MFTFASRRIAVLVSLVAALTLLTGLVLWLARSTTVRSNQAADTQLLSPAAGSGPMFLAEPGPNTDDPCKGLITFTIGGVQYCTQGFDPEPPGVAQRVPPIDFSARAMNAAIVCDGDGVSGNRVQVLYVHPPETNRYSEYLTSFQQWAKDMDDIYNASAAETGGTRHVRFVHDSSCVATVLNVQVSSASMAQADPFDMWNEVAALGYNRTDRIYVIFAETSAYSLGIANFWWDDSLSPGNRNNRGPSYTSSPVNLWGGSNPAHESMHTLGAVNASAPHSNGGGHCYDEYDRMCYGNNMQYLCTDPAHEQRFDCNHDDYFNTNPAEGSYLANYWNAANNSFLIGAASIVKTWTGDTSTDWHTASNWSPASVPGSGEDCLIPAGRPRYPILLGTTEAYCEGTLTVEPGAQIVDGPVGALHAETAIISGTVQVLNGSYFDIDSAASVRPGGLLVLQNGDIGMMFYSGGTLNVNGTVRVTGTFPIYGSIEPANLLINTGGLVEILEGGLLTVDGAVTNTGTLSQTKTVPQNATTSFLVITATTGGTRYFGVDVTLGNVGNMGPTSVAIQGNQSCSAAFRTLGMAVGRCYSIAPTTPHTATVKFYYRSAEALGNPAPVAYHLTGSTWISLTSTRGGSGEAMFVQAANVDSYSPFALKDPNVTTYYVVLPLILR